MSTRIREHFACLPFQISHFDRLAEVGQILGLEGEFLTSGFDARMDDDGHIYFDWNRAKQVSEYIREHYSLDHLKHIMSIHKQRLFNLQQLLDKNGRNYTDIQSLSDLSHAVASLAPYGLATKILPDAIRGMIEDKLHKSGKNVTPAKIDQLLTPESSGATRLAEALAIAGDNLENMDDVSGCAEAICHEFRGFGPHAWEAPGYETKGFVLNIFKSGIQINHVNNDENSNHFIDPGSC